MSRRNQAIMAALALVSAPIAFGAEADDACTRDALPRPVTRTVVEGHILPTTVEHRPEGVFTSGPMELLVARVSADGKLVRACVDTEEAARLFLEKPVVTPRTEAKEQ